MSRKDTNVLALDSVAKRIFESNQSGSNASKSTDAIGQTASIENIPPKTLWKTREWLQQQLIEQNGALKSFQRSKETLADDPEELEMRTIDLQDKLLDTETGFYLRNYVIQRLQLGDTLLKTLYPDEGGGIHTRSNKGSATKKKLEGLLLKEEQLGSAILRIQEEIKEMTPALDEKKKRNLDLDQSNRSLTWNLEQAKLRSNTRQEEKSSSAVKEVVVTYDKLVAKVELVRHSLQALVLASGVHWMEDDELRELMISVGTPVDHLFE